MPITLISMLFTLVIGGAGIVFFLNDPTPLETLSHYYSSKGDSGAETAGKLITLIPIAFALNGLICWLPFLIALYSWIKEKVQSGKLKTSNRQ